MVPIPIFLGVIVRIEPLDSGVVADYLLGIEQIADSAVVPEHPAGINAGGAVGKPDPFRIRNSLYVCALVFRLNGIAPVLQYHIGDIFDCRAYRDAFHIKFVYPYLSVGLHRGRRLSNKGEFDSQAVGIRFHEGSYCGLQR